MKNIIKTDNYLLIVSDEIPTTWYYDTYLNKLRHTGGAEYGESSISKKVIGHLPLNNSPILEGVDLLPPLEDEIEKLAKQEILYNDQKRAWWKQGYNKAKEKYKWTDEDLRKVLTDKLLYELSVDEIIQSLQQPKYPIGFECEMVTRVFDVYPQTINHIPKTTTNSQGQTVLEGKYIYE